MRRRDQHDRDMVLAWHFAVLAGAMLGGKLPRLETLVSHRGPARQSIGQMKQTLKMLGFKPREVHG